MRFATLFALCFALATSPAFASIQGSYSGNYQVGTQGNAAYSYIHTSYTADKWGEAEYFQEAGGDVLYAIDTNQSVNFFFEDNGTAGLNNGDRVLFNNSSIGVRAHSGSLGSPNTSPIVGSLTLSGALTVNGTPSSSFSHGIRNITVTDTDPGHTGLFYTIKSLSDTVLYEGEFFFQSGALAGPFNGIEYDASTDSITFALWGNSLNKGDRQSGVDGNGQEAQLGGDFFLSGIRLPDPGGQIQSAPEATSLVVWSLLAFIGLSASRRKSI